MALKILDLSGDNLVEQPPASQTIIAVSAAAGGLARIDAIIREDAPLPHDYVSGTLHWNDGSAPVVYNGTYAGTLAISEYKNLVPGTYVARLEAHNYKTPIWDEVSVNFGFTVKLNASLSAKPPLLYGPILPKDAGYPNANQWDWNTGVDLEVLSSSVKMLMLTSKGERVMQPEYGTNIRATLFELKTSGVESVVQNDISEALSRWEPRVAIQKLSVSWISDREVVVTAVLISRLNQLSFEIPMTFTK